MNNQRLPKTVSRNIHILTLGCAKNEVDSSRMAQSLQAEGFAVVPSPKEADAIIVNTCSFIEAAVEESIDALLDMLDDEHVKGNGIPVICTGCMPARYGSSLEEEMPDIAAFVPCGGETDIVSVLNGILTSDASEPRAGNQPSQCGDGPDFQADAAMPRISGIASSACPEGKFAYLKISDGCDRWCSYCTIPIIRGRYKSFSLEDIHHQAAHLVNEGARELVLIGQDTGIWGHDLDQGLCLADLLEYLAEKFPDTWIRVMYTQPEYITDGLLSAMKRHRNIANYLDIPFQHIEQSIIESMNRKGSKTDYMDLIGHIRSVIPDITLRTTLMCGFPGETESDFESLCSFVEAAEFDYVGVFAFSPEEGTKAFAMGDQVDPDERAYRARTLQALADAVSASRISERIGLTYPVLIEGEEEDGQLFGRAICQAPEVDGVTYINRGCVGDITPVVIEDTLIYDMEGSFDE